MVHKYATLQSTELKTGELYKVFSVYGFYFGIFEFAFLGQGGLPYFMEPNGLILPYYCKIECTIPTELEVALA